MALSDFQFTYNGLTFGDSTAYDVVQAEGLDSLPDIRSFDQLRSDDHGSWMGVDLAGGRTVAFEIEVLGSSDAAFRSNLEALLAATVVQPSELPLSFQLPGMPGNRRIYCRPRKRATLVDFDYAMRHASVALEFGATDPRVYDDTLQNVVIPVGTSGGGFTFNLAFNLSFGSASTSGSAQLLNAGNFATRPVITIAGPVDNPTVENATSGQHLTFALSIAAGDTLVLDLDARTALYFVGGTGVGASRRSSMSSDSQWWELSPGTSQINYRANTVQVGSTATVVFRSAWM